jgi:AcrR family transcriptional regulator
MEPTRARPAGRRRDSAKTREDILASARSAFAESGFDGVGVREIARRAGVTAMLINRYFGSKEHLYAEVVADTMSSPRILRPEVLGAPRPDEAIASALVDLTAPGATPLDGFKILFHSASSKQAAAIGREQIALRDLRVMTEALSGEHASERAAIVLALVAGVQVFRQMIGLDALTHADPEVLKSILAPVVQQLIERPNVVRSPTV